MTPRSGAPAATSTPLRAVLAALPTARTAEQVQRATGLPRDVVQAALDHLERVGRIHPVRIAAGAGGCPAAGCRSCPQAGGCSG